jgi:NAD(P)H-hydrate repair Nnr-like enzyme with NAD(P)H-hydrate dehydratase domain
VIAHPDGRVAINTTGNAGLATGGAGDVLSGLTGTLLAQGWDAWLAALGAVWLHGAAADRLVADGIGPIGLAASELPAAIRTAFNALITAGAVPPRS